MANPEHVALVRKGAVTIAQWRRAHPNERLDLSNADLSGAKFHGAELSEANLSGADLRWANFWETNLSRAKLREADLSWADLWRINLSGADLSRANLTEADIWEANLSKANFSEVHLSNAYLTRTNLSEADFSRARLDLTSLSNVDLSTAKGLATVKHSAASSVGMDTLIASMRGAGNKLTPDLTTFFRGAGVPQEVLDVLPKIVSEINYYSCFISYGQPDVEFAKKLYEDLKARGVSCWLYEMDKTVGKRTRSEIGESRRGADRFVVLCSAAALVRDGVLEEIEDQISDDPDRLVPISLDNLWKEPGFRIMRGTHDLKPDLVNRNYADFANRPYEGALEELLKGLRRPAVKKPRRKKG